VVTFHRDGSTLTVSAAGSPVTLTYDNGCIVRTTTPVTVRMSARGCA
jgi:hypothetical protein